MRFVGLVTARGGSKGVPGKNIAPVGGIPLIEWSIRAARSSRLERCIVSTDSEDIAAVCRSVGAEVPFIRPPELARDDSPHIDVILHALDWLERDTGVPEYLVLLQPTSPFRTGKDIDAAIDIAIKQDADSVISLFQAPVHPYWVRSLDAEGQISDFMKWPTDSGYLQRQILPPAFAMNGAVYVLKSSVLRDRGTYFTERTFGYVMPEDRSLDIDTAWDLKIADLLLREMHDLG
jgi:CMP-N-acetylneuraminic acid synthetase